jgi:hypothetical protein
MKKITFAAFACFTSSALLSGVPLSAAQAHAVDWNNRARCTPTDPEGRRIVTRYGNAKLGWQHFTHRHNIRVCKIIDGAIRGRVDRSDNQGRKEYDGVAIRKGNRPQQVRFTVIVQYTRFTKDRVYDAGPGQTIGVVNAFCHNQPNNKCPAWMNE